MNEFFQDLSGEDRPEWMFWPRAKLQKIPPRHVGGGVYKSFGVDECEGFVYSDADGNPLPEGDLDPNMPRGVPDDVVAEYLVAERQRDTDWIRLFTNY